jgi:hypothetical protein
MTVAICCWIHNADSSSGLWAVRQGEAEAFWSGLAAATQDLSAVSVSSVGSVAPQIVSRSISLMVVLLR